MEGTKKGIHSYLLGHTRTPRFAKGLDCSLDDSQRYIQPHTEELRPRLGLVESFVQQPSEIYQECSATIASKSLIISNFIKVEPSDNLKRM